MHSCSDVSGTALNCRTTVQLSSQINLVLYVELFIQLCIFLDHYTAKFHYLVGLGATPQPHHIMWSSASEDYKILQLC